VAPGDLRAPGQHVDRDSSSGHVELCARRDNGNGEHTVPVGPFKRPEHRRNDRPDKHADIDRATPHSVGIPGVSRSVIGGRP